MGVLLVFHVARQRTATMRSTRKQDVTCWRLTSPGTLAIPSGVGCCCRRVHAEWGVWGKANDSRLSR